FQALNYARENAHLKATYKNLFDSISVSRTQTKTIITSLQNELQSTIHKNAKLRTQLFKKVSDQKDNTYDTSKNTKFAKQSILGKPPMLDEIHALSKPVTSNTISTPQEPKGYSDLFMVHRFRLFQAHDMKSKASHQFRLEVYGNCRFGNDHVATILGFGDLQWGNILITRVYFIEGLGHNLFSIGQFNDSDLEVAFRRNACFVRKLEGVD
nr:integrase, catalytic region, zinc finger, CCHC-type, peptidase aspartic, catalytic [Tanacetum cinerariifolium]